MFDNPQIGQRIRPRLSAVENRVASTFVELGLDRNKMLESKPGLVLCPTLYVEPPTPLCDRAIDFELNAAFSRWRQQPKSSAMGAAVLYHRSQQLRLASFSRSNLPFKVAGDLQLICQPIAYGVMARRPYVQALLEGDPTTVIDGGDLLSMGQDEMLRNVRGVLAGLPTSAQVTEIATQPVIVRTYAEDKQTTFLVMNASPWAATVQVTLDVPRGSSLDPLAAPEEKTGNAPIKPLLLAAGRQPWALTLEPCDVRAVRIAVPGAKAVEVHADLSDVAHAELKAQLAELANRDLSAPHTCTALSNPSFEPLGGPLPSWRLVNNVPGVTAMLDATAPQDGKTSLYLSSNGLSAAIESDAFPIPSTGQLAMTVFARGKNMGTGTEVRLVFESEGGQPVYRRAASVRGAETERENQLWGRPFAILVNDLPCNLQRNMRIVFELTGPGEVWLDNVKLYDLLFPLKFYGNAEAEILQLFKLTHAAQNAYDAGQVSDCLQLIDGYWPRFVMSYTAPAAPKVAAIPAPMSTNADSVHSSSAPDSPSASPSNESEQPPPGVGDRLKRWVPILR